MQQLRDKPYFALLKVTLGRINVEDSYLIEISKTKCTRYTDNILERAFIASTVGCLRMGKIVQYVNHTAQFTFEPSHKYQREFFVMIFQPFGKILFTMKIPLITQKPINSYQMCFQVRPLGFGRNSFYGS